MREYVIAKSNSPQGEDFQTRIKGKAYKIKAKQTCEGCSVQSINIGEVTNVLYMECACGHLQMSEGLKWTSMEHFEPLSKDNVSKAIEYALEEEDYELCVKMRDL